MTTTTHGYVVIDRRDGFNLCGRETLRAPFTTRTAAQQLADRLNAVHPAKPYAVTCTDSTERYIR